MRCSRLVMSNFCNYEYQEVNFGTGVIGILGPNGSGKSNTFAALRLAFTGYNSNAGTKTANVYAKAKKNAPSYVELTFSHNGVEATVRRNLRPASPTATLRFSDGQVIEGDTKVTARIEQILGITSDVINDIVIVEQEAIFGFLSAMPAKRLEQFQKLFGTDHATTVHKQLVEYMKGVQLPVSGASLDALRQTRDADLQQLVVIESQLQTYVPTAQLLDEISQIAGLQTQYREWQGCLQRLNQAEAMVESLQQRLTAAADGHARAVVRRDELQVNVAKLQPAAETARQQLANAAAAEQNHAYHKTLETAVTQATLRLEIVTAARPVPPETLVEDVEAAEQTLSQLNADIIGLRRYVSAFHDGVTECPTCHMPKMEFKDAIDAAAVQLAEKGEQQAALSFAVAATRSHRTATERFSQSVQAATRALQTAMANLEQHPLAAAVVVDAVAANTVIREEAMLRQDLQRVLAELSGYEAEQRHIQQSLDATTATVAAERATLAAIDTRLLVNMDLTTAAARDAELRELVAKRQALEQQLTYVTTSVANLNERIAEAIGTAAMAEKTQAWLNYIGQLRDLFARDAAPRFVSQTNLQRLESSINDVLAEFSAPFRVAATEGLSFTATFAAGYQQPAERLSPGQKVLLALAFRLSLNLMFANNIGAMYLDEPTAWMDKQRIQGFGPVLQRLREFAASRGLQTVIITHESDLAPLFDSTILL